MAAYLAVQMQSLWVVRDDIQWAGPAADIPQRRSRYAQQPQVALRLQAHICQGACRRLQLLHVPSRCRRLLFGVACKSRVWQSMRQQP